MLFEFGQYRVDIDVERTREFYKKAGLISEECSCDGCLNFENAVDVLPPDVTSFFSKLGIEMKKACEVYVYDCPDRGTLLYGGFYHVCGTILSGKSAWVSTDPYGSHWEEDLAYSVTQDFHVSFQDSCVMLEDEFPLPALQLEILADIPWVLLKENTYKLVYPLSSSPESDESINPDGDRK